VRRVNKMPGEGGEAPSDRLTVDKLRHSTKRNSWIVLGEGQGIQVGESTGGVEA
jgi:hypothetical protein